MNRKKMIGYILIAVGSLIGIYGGYLVDRSSNEDSTKDKNEIIDAGKENKEYLSKEIEALRKAVLNSSKKFYDIEKETGFTYEQLKELSKDILKKSNSHLDRGHAYFLIGDYIESINEYSLAIEINKYSAIAYFQRAKTRFQLIYNLAPTSSISETQEVYVDELNVDKSVEKDVEIEKIKNDYSKAIGLENEEIVELSYSNRGIFYSAIDEFDNALSDFKNAIELNKSEADNYNNRGIVYSDMAFSSNEKVNYDLAINDFEKAISLNPGRALYYYNLGVVYLRTKNYNQCITFNNKALDLNPNYTKALNNRGISYFYLSNYENAKKDLVGIEPKSPTLYAILGESSFYLKSYNDAINYFSTAIQLGVVNEKIYHLRGVSFSLKQNYKNAIEDFSKAIEIDSTTPHFYTERGSCYALLKDYKSSIQDFNSSIKLNKNDYKVYFNRGLSHFNMQNYKEALKDFKESLKINPNNERARVYITEIKNKIKR